MATNGSWTDRHIRALWGDKETIEKIYPPCDTQDIIDQIPIDSDKLPRKNRMVSFAQFRPEKDHALQLKIWREVLKKLPLEDATFLLIGATRG